MSSPSRLIVIALGLNGNFMTTFCTSNYNLTLLLDHVELLIKVVIPVVAFSLASPYCH